MQKQQLLKLLSISLLLTACGSNSSNTTDSNTNSNSDNKVGYLIDSAVGGVEYRCGAEIGITGNDGKFVCPTLPVSFYIGSIKLGSIVNIPNDNKVFPQDIVGVDRDKVEDDGVVKLATLLQSLDSDGKAENGITISSDTRERFVDDMETLLEEVELAELQELHPDIKLIEQNAVVSHLSFSLNGVTEENQDENTDAHGDSTLGETIGGDNGDDDDTASGDTSRSDIKLPSTYTHQAINNQGVAVEGSVKNYTIRIYSDSQEIVNAQSLHQGVVVKVNGEASENIAIQATYIDKKIVVALYDQSGQLIKVSDEILVTDVPVVIVELNL